MKKLFLLGLLLILVMSPDGNLSAADKPFAGVELNFLVLTNHREGLDQLLPEFAAETGIKINLIPVSMPDLYTRLGTEFAAGGQSYDVSEMMWEAAQGYARADRLLVLDELIKKHNVDLSQYTNVYVQKHMIQYPQTPQGKYICLPYLADVQILAYRRDLFEDPKEKEAFKTKYGRELAVPETFEDFQRVAEFFTRESKGDGQANLYGTVVLGKNFPSLVGDVTPYLRGHGGDWIDKNYKPVISSPKSLAGLKYYYDLFAQAKVTPRGCATYAWEEEIADFQNGRLAMMIVWPGGQVAALENEKVSKVADKIGYAVVPGKSPTLGGWAVAVPAKAKNPEASFLFIKWLTSTKVALERARKAGFFTAAQALYDDPGMKQKYKYLEAFKASLPNGQGWPQIGEFTSIWKIGAQELSRAFAGELTVEDAAKIMQKKLEQLMKEGGYY